MPNRFPSTLISSCALVLLACGPDGPTAAGGPVIELESGDGQVAAPGNPLDRPLVARIHDSHSRPVRNAPVRWVTNAGQVTALSPTTDADGKAAAVWQLGEADGAQRAVVYANGVDSVAFTAYADGTVLPDRSPLRVIDLETYDRSGQAVHPDIAVGPFAGLDADPRLVITPYPGGNSWFENPSLFVRTGRTGWTVPQGVTNPLVTPDRGYLSDPDILWLEDQHEFRLFYRGVTLTNDILVVRSADGVRWSAPSLVVRVPNHEAISPTIVRRAPNDWLMWTVNSGGYGCSSASTTVELRRSADGETWSSPTAVSLDQDGVYAWHIDVEWMPALGQYWALYNGKVPGSCTTGALYLATSADGLNWRTYESPVLRRGAIPEFTDVVYRATFAYDSARDVVSIWHSGARAAPYGYEWHTAFERLRRSDLLDRVNRRDTAALIPSSATPLTDRTAP